MDSTPAIGRDGTIYVGSDDDTFYAINPDGTEKWNYTTGADIASSAAIDLDGTIYVGSDDKNMYALYPNGTLKWSSGLTSYSYITSPTINTDYIYI